MSRQQELAALTEDPNLWNDAPKAQKLMTEKNRLDADIADYQRLEQNKKDLADLIELAESENDETVLAEAAAQLEALQKEAAAKELESLLSGEADSNDTFLEIHPGAGGTEAQDWAEMLLRMYQRYVALRGYQAEILDITEGDGAGIKGVTLKIEGENAYGYLKAEKGVHRLVRISPFDSNARRHTSFASVEVIPEIKNDNEIEIKPEDLKIDTFHSGGCGGQGVNTTDSAVRVKHIPTGIVVQCQNERSQIQNKETAINVLKSKLAQLQEEQQQKDLNKIQGDLKKIEWGSQIRSYVFHPYNMVKDHRTDYETSDTTGVMNGKIQPFIEEYLKKSAT